MHKHLQNVLKPLFVFAGFLFLACTCSPKYIGNWMYYFHIAFSANNFGEMRNICFHLSFSSWFIKFKFILSQLVERWTSWCDMSIIYAELQILSSFNEPIQSTERNIWLIKLKLYRNINYLEGPSICTYSYFYQPHTRCCWFGTLVMF